jgi:WNK lysine deficient protein kinase
MVAAHAKRVRELKHENLATLFDFWISSDSTRAFFITEAVESRSVVDTFLRDSTVLRPRVIARWFTPILGLLHYLHSQSPPLVHHKIQLSSIFVRSSSGCIKVGLPLLVPWHIFLGHCVIKLSAMTPPEYLCGEATPASDIWCFGLALLEAITKQIPYSECETPAQLVERLLRYQPPDCIKDVNDPFAADLIRSCLQRPQLRPLARDLIEHAFFTRDYGGDERQDAAPASTDMIIIYSGQKAAPGYNKEPQRLSLRASGPIASSVPRMFPKG